MEVPFSGAPGGALTMSLGSDASTFYYSRNKVRCGLKQLNLSERSTHGARASGRLLSVEGREDAPRLSTLVTRAARAQFQMLALSVEQVEGSKAARQKTVPALPTAFEDVDDGRLRVLYKEIVARFKAGASAGVRQKVLGKFGFVERAPSPFVADQFVITQTTLHHAGAELVAAANAMAELDEVLFAVPNFVSEFSRVLVPKADQWHLRNGGGGGQTKGADIGALEAWKATTGKSSVVIAVIDDGIDLRHPDLRGRLLRNPDKKDKKDKYGRDFFLRDTHPDHYDPSPKRYQVPYDQLDGNDIHGTSCAGVAVADGAHGKRVLGVAPGCRLLPVKIFHGNELAEDHQVASAIRYAALFAQVLSCSWTGPQSPDLEFAFEDIQAERRGRGVVVCAAAGNDGRASVSYPARDPNVIAVGASTDRDERADYSNYGRELSVVAPSNGGVKGVYTTDVSQASRGFNTGDVAAGDAAGLYTNDFGGTSSATPLVAGVAGLMISRNGRLKADEVRAVLQTTARKIGAVKYVNGRNDEYGHGCVSAGAAVTHGLVSPPGGLSKKSVSRGSGSSGSASRGKRAKKGRAAARSR